MASGKGPWVRPSSLAALRCAALLAHWDIEIQQILPSAAQAAKPSATAVSRNATSAWWSSINWWRRPKGVQYTLSVMIKTFNAQLANFNACGAGT